jgi:O-antigen ligase
MAIDFPVLGSGFGTFAVVYPLYRSDEVRKFYQYAHCDLLQVAAEGGVVGVTLVLLVLVPLGRRTLRGLRGVQGIVGVGVAAGLAAVLLHSLVDFDFHIPSNAAIAAILAGGVLGLPWITES